MHMKTIFLASTAFLVVSAAALFAVGAAFAADATEDIIPAGFVWSGGYVGLQAGYAGFRSHYLDVAGSTADPEPDGFFGGLYTGYNHQFENQLVLGIEADINIAGIDGQSDFIFADGKSDLDHKLAAEVKWNGALRARFGYAVDRFMPYIAGGLSAAHYEFTLRHDDGSEHPGEKAIWTGWTVGAGIEYAATDTLLVRAEYRYTDYGSRESDHLWSSTQHSDTDLTSHDIRLGIAYKF
jgi:outer membrane immunogenic protein